jgi:hypothetical protein
MPFSSYIDSSQPRSGKMTKKLNAYSAKISMTPKNNHNKSKFKVKTILDAHPTRCIVERMHCLIVDGGGI